MLLIFWMCHSMIFFVEIKKVLFLQQTFVKNYHFNNQKYFNAKGFTLLLMIFDSITWLHLVLFFFQTMCNLKAHLPKMFLGMKIVTAVCHK